MKLIFLILTGLFMSANMVIAQTADQKAVADAVEKFRKTMVEPNEAVFESLTASALSYGHSNGLVEDQKTCIASMVTGKYNFETLELTEQTIQIVDQTALVRHTFFANTHDAGKDPGTVKLKVLQIWLKQKGKWLLVARQAVRI